MVQKKIKGKKKEGKKRYGVKKSEGNKKRILLIEKYMDDFLIEKRKKHSFQFIGYDKQTNRQTDKQKNKQTYIKKPNKHTNRKTHKRI